MKLKYSIFRYSLTAALLVLVSTSFAQNIPVEKKAETTGSLTEEIEVVRPYKPVLADAVKIRRNPNLNDIEPFKPQLSYNILDKRQELNTDIRQLQAQEPLKKPDVILKNNYLKIGAGNMNGGLGELYMNTGNDQALQAGFFLKHLAQEGSLNKQKFSVEKASLFGKSILDQVTLNGELGYDRRSTYFYGYNPANPLANADPAKQRFDMVTLKGEILKNYKEKDNISYALKGDAYLLKNILATKENSLALSGFFNKAWNQFNFGINTSVDFTANKDAVYNISNNIARVNPYIKFQGPNYKLTLGMNLVQEFGTTSRSNVLPAVTAEADIIPKYATIYAGFTGDVLKTSIRALSEEDPYLNNNLTIKNAVEKVNIFGGIKGNAGTGFGYKATAFYKTISNLPLLVNSVSGMEKFDVVYDGGDSKIVGLEGEISLSTTEMFSWTGKLIIDNYTLATEASAWFKPDFQLLSDARLSVNKKFIIDGSVIVNGGSEAKTYTYTPAPVESIVSIKSFVDLSAGAEYHFTDKIGLYLHVNNILGTQYQQYLYYSKLGLNVIGGFNFSF